MSKIPGQSKIVGVKVGEKEDLSDLVLEIHVEFALRAIQDFYDFLKKLIQ